MDTFKTTPFKHQLDSLNISKGRAFFADLSEMGTGKTWVRINEAAQLWGEGRLTGALLFAPKGVHSNWILSQIPIHMPDWVGYIAREWNADANKADQRITDEIFKPYSGADRPPLRILAMNWDGLQTERGIEYAVQFCETHKNLMIICDESQRIKNPKAVRTKALMRKVRRYSMDGGYRRIMSGSAVLQGPFDLFSQFGFLDENILQTTSYFAFKAEYAEMLQPGNKLLEHIMHRRTKMPVEERAALNQDYSALNSMLEANGRGELLEIGMELGVAIESAEFETAARKLQELRVMFDPSVRSEKKTRALQIVAGIERRIGVHLRKVQETNSNPYRLPQVVAKGADNKPKYRNLDKLNKLIAPHSFRVLKADCLDLPKKVYTQSWFRMTDAQAKAYAMMKEETRLQLSDGSIAAVAKLASIMKLSQICSGFLIEPITKNIIKLMSDENNPKLQLLKSRMEGSLEDDQQIIVWARFHEEIDQIVALCAANGWEACQYDGRTPPVERPKLVAAFEEGRKSVFIGQQRTGGTGITLVAASRVFYYSNTFSLEDRIQSEDRAHRIGQERDVTYEDILCAGTIDVKITKALRAKQEVASIIVGDVGRLLDEAVLI